MPRIDSKLETGDAHFRLALKRNRFNTFNTVFFYPTSQTYRVDVTKELNSMARTI